MKRAFAGICLLTNLWTCTASAQTSAELQCLPVGIFDGGFSIEAVKTPDEGEKLYSAEVRSEGWLQKVVFQGKMRLVTDKESESCRYRFVDSEENPTTVISLIPGQDAIFEKLNGRSLASKINGVWTNRDNRLHCSGSKDFREKLKSLCQ